ncbi:MAG: hypothetical protein H7A25_05350 [Leptospiraceae bacterium]|nr:hypothetical protein [Leptospiraceae bacterium]MCP5499306.1 hypothetical protein [Leptospiraceae bacterium]
MNATAKKRARNTSQNRVGKMRYELYRNAIEWLQNAIDRQYYMEAISLEGSLISDRLESRLQQISGDDSGFRTLENLIQTLSLEENDETLKELLNHDLNSWRMEHDFALHDMVKFLEGETPSWENRIEHNRNIALEGLRLFRQIDREVKRLKHSNI